MVSKGVLTTKFFELLIVKLPVAEILRVAPLFTHTLLAEAAAAMLGWLVMPVGSSTSLVAVGTLAGVQLQGFAQSVSTEPFQTSVVVGEGVAVQPAALTTTLVVVETLQVPLPLEIVTV